MLWNFVFMQELYFTDNGRDELGDNMPDCELNRLTQEGQDFGIPYCDVSADSTCATKSLNLKRF
jgi:glucose/arabinose dehydrogenase